jgi:hypothetical protein
MVSAACLRSSVTRSSFGPSRRPSTSPRIRRSDRSANVSAMDAPFSSTVIAVASDPAGSAISTRASPPDTRSARLESTTTCRSRTESTPRHAVPAATRSTSSTRRVTAALHSAPPRRSTGLRQREAGSPARPTARQPCAPRRHSLRDRRSAPRASGAHRPPRHDPLA